MHNDSYRSCDEHVRRCRLGCRRTDSAEEHEPATISGKARQGETLTAAPGTWTGTQPITFTYQWRRCNSNGGSCANISGATKKTYTLGRRTSTTRFRVRLCASNTTGAAAASSAPTAVVAAAKSISLDRNRSIAVYGRTVLLTGSLRNGEAVIITEHRSLRSAASRHTPWLP
jgi:hypothetical protein